jgi:protocatechuate 3,4-dioxygenase beta subunit
MATHTTSRFVLIVTAFTVALAAPTRGQGTAQVPRDARAGVPAAVGTSEITGTVTLTGTGQPARRARVRLNGADVGGSSTTMTDELGRFSFKGLIAGKYTLNASKPGHVSGSYGQVAPGRPGTAIQLRDAEKFEAKLQIARGGVITGTVVDEHGEAIPGTQVRVLRYAIQAGQRTLQQSGSASTDDRGIYRIFGLQPGEYVLAATPRNADGPMALAVRARAELEQLRERMGRGGGRGEQAEQVLRLRQSLLESQIPDEEEEATGYAPVYYPGTTAPAQATSILLAVSEERSGIDMQLQRVPVATVEGVVVNPTAQPVQNIQVVLSNTAQRVPGSGTISARADNEGRFRLANVAPGQYTLMARGVVAAAREANARGQAPGRGRAGGRGPQSTDRLWAAADITVDGRNMSNIALTLQAGLTISGRIVFNATTNTAPTDLSRLRVNAVPADPGVGRELLSPAQGSVDAGGRFTIPGVIPGRYRINASGAGSGWHMESSVLDGLDTLDFPADVKPGQTLTSALITFIDRQSTLTGTVVNQRGQPAPGYTVILYASDQRYWGPLSRRIRTARPATDGVFTFTNLPPGDYRIVPVVDAEPGSWFDPGFLQQIDPAADRVQIAEGERKVVSLRVSTP